MHYSLVEAEKEVVKGSAERLNFNWYFQQAPNREEMNQMARYYWFGYNHISGAHVNVEEVDNNGTPNLFI